MFRLHGFYRSSASYRVRIGLNLKGVAWENLPKRLRGGEHRSAEFTALNPQQLVPVLEHDGRALNQSLAILEYLDDIVPEPSLLPRSAVDRATVRAFAQIVACEMHPLCNLRVLQFLESDMHAPKERVTHWYHHWMAAGFPALESMIARHGSESRCFGDSITLADVCIVPQVYNARRFEFDLEPFPKVRSVVASLEQLPAFAAAHPDVQPDAAG